MKKIEILSIHNLFYFLFILVLIFGFTTIVDLRPNSQTQTGNAISGEWTSYTSAFSGSGIESDPYEITSAENLAYLASQVNSGTTYSGSFFRQTANIDLSAHYWVPIGTDSTNIFRGTYDGDGHTISNMTTSEVQYSGLFGYVRSATIQNLGIENSTISASSSTAYAGGIAGYANSTTISNCYNTGSVTASSTSSTAFAGGIAGYANLKTIINCYNSGSISATSTASAGIIIYVNAGGIVGHASLTIRNCYNSGSVSATSSHVKPRAGGIAGYASATIRNCYNSGSVSVTDSSFANVGGLVGNSSAKISYSYNSGSVSATSSSSAFVGGMMGCSAQSESTIRNCYNTGSVIAASTTVGAGGISGYSNLVATISNCYNTGSVSASASSTANAGGVMGVAEGSPTISNCYYGGNCTLNYGIGSSSSNTGCTKQSNLTIDVQPKTESWYTNKSNWDSTYPWDFEDTWMIVSGLNDGYPVFTWQLNQLEYTLNFNANGGTLNIGGQIKVTYGSTYTMPSTSNVTRTGYTLTGWRAVVNNSTYTYNPGEVITIPTWTMTQTTVTFYAQWRANTYTVKFDDQGGVTNYADMALMKADYSNNDGYTFTSEDKKMTVSYDYDQNGDWILTLNGTPKESFLIFINFLAGNETFTAKDIYKVTYSHVSGDIVGLESGCFVLEVCDSNWKNLTTRNNTNFWILSANASITLAISDYAVKNGAGIKLWFWYNANASPAREFKNYKVKMKIEKVGTQKNKNIKIVYDSALKAIAPPTKTGYDFQGYYTGTNGNGTQYFDSNGCPKIANMNIAENTTLYAHWKAKEDCVLTFNANGGVVSPTSRNQTFNAPLVDLPIPTRQGYIFTGWYTSKDGDTEVTSSTIMNKESMTIYAHWAETWAADHYSSELTQNGGYWLISDSADLARLIHLINYTTRTDVLTMKFKLTDHIDMSAYYWEPVGTESRAFQGEFNGQGYTIKGLHTISQSLRRDGGGDNSGLFGVTSTGAIIKNVYLEELDIHGLDRVGAIVGYVKGTTTITAVAVEGTVTATGSNYGAIVGSSSTCTINDCLIIVDGIKGGNNNGLYSGTATITNTLYDISGLRGRSSGTFDNWVYVTNMQYPLPKEISWIASGSEPIEDNVLALSTANNLVQCGDMEGRGWQVNNGTVAYSSEDVYEGEYSIKLTGDTSKSEQTVTTSDTYYLNSDHIYYFAIFVKSSLSSNARVDIYWPVAEPGMGAQYITIANSWQMYSWKVSRNSFTSGEYPLRVDFDNNYQNGTMYIDNLILLDLTEIFGAGNEPDKAWIDKNLAIVSIDGITSEQYTFLSAQNLYQYGDMEGEGWTTNSSVQYSTEHVFTGNYALKLTGTSSSQEILAQTSETLELDPTHIYYVSVYGYQESKDGKESVECYWPVAEPVMGGIAVGAVGEWNLYSWRATRTSFTSGSYQLRLDFNNKLCNSTFYFDNLRIIDLTATFGEGNEPDKSWLDANAYLLL